MAKRRHRKSSRDPLQVQISVRLKMPRRRGKPTKPTATLTQQAIQYRIKHGHDHPMATTKIIRWRNPARRGALASWRQGNQSDAWDTLANALSETIVDVVAHGDDEGNDDD